MLALEFLNKGWTLLLVSFNKFGYVLGTILQEHSWMTACKKSYKQSSECLVLVSENLISVDFISWFFVFHVLQNTTVRYWCSIYSFTDKNWIYTDHAEFGLLSRRLLAQKLKVNYEDARTMCEICSELTIKTPERHQRRCSGVFNDNFEQISHIVLTFPWLTLSKYIQAG